MATFSNLIQSEYYAGKKWVSMEGIELEHYCVQQNVVPTAVNTNTTRRAVFD